MVLVLVLGRKRGRTRWVRRGFSAEARKVELEASGVLLTRNVPLRRRLLAPAPRTTVSHRIRRATVSSVRVAAREYPRDSYAETMQRREE